MKKIVCLFLIFLSCFCVFGCKSNENIDAKIIDVEDIVINKSHAYCNIGEKVVLLAQVFPFNANNQNVLWKSDNQNIAIVSDGVVEGLNEGRTVISAVSEDGEFCDTCVLFVSSPKLDYDKYQNNLSAKSQGYKQNVNQKAQVQNLNFDDEKQSLWQDFFEKFYKDFEYLQNQIYTIKNNIFNSTLQENGENVGEYSKITQKNDNFVELLQNLESKNEEYPLGNESENHGYFFEYKFNSNGIDDEADEFTNYINDKEIVREFSW